VSRWWCGASGWRVQWPPSWVWLFGITLWLEPGQEGLYGRAKRANGVGSRLAKSGYAAATALLARGIQVIATDLETSPLMQQRADRLTAMGAQVVLGEHPLNLLEPVDYVVTSPGVPDTAPIIMEGKRRNRPIISEPELAYWLYPGRIWR